MSFELLESEVNGGRAPQHCLNPGTTEGALASAETSVGVSFPPQLRLLLLKYNGGTLFGGGYPWLYLYSIQDDCHAKRCSYDIDVCREYAKNQVWRSRTMVPIANTSDGESYAIHSTGGQVFRWDIEEQEIVKEADTLEQWLADMLDVGREGID